MVGAFIFSSGGKISPPNCKTSCGLSGEEPHIDDFLRRGKINTSDWDRASRKALEEARLSPDPSMTPDQVVTTVLRTLRNNDTPYENHGCEVASRFCCSTNPASRLQPKELRRYLSDDEEMPFYKILSAWDEIEEPTIASTGKRLSATSRAVSTATVMVRLRQQSSAWSTVNFDLSQEDGMWLLDRLWVDNAVDSYRAGYPSGVEDLLRDSANDILTTTFSDYTPEQLVNWIETEPYPAMTPKAVVLNSLLALHKDVRDIPERHAGCAIVGRFCSPSNPASDLSPSHFAAYLNDYPWYKIMGEWNEMTIHSEECDSDTADIVVLLKRKGEGEWTSVNWELSNVDGLWLTQRIWVDDRGGLSSQGGSGTSEDG
jgi:hypothetical protein